MHSGARSTGRIPCFSGFDRWSFPKSGLCALHPPALGGQPSALARDGLVLLTAAPTAMSDIIPVYRNEYLAIRAVVFIESLVIVAYVVHKLYYNRHHIHQSVKTKHFDAKSALRTAHHNTKSKLSRLKTKIRVAHALNTTNLAHGRLTSTPSRRTQITPEDDVFDVVNMMESGVVGPQSSNQRSSPKDQPSAAPASPPFWVIDETDVKLTTRLAAGHFGDIFLGHWVGCVVAVKKIQLEKKNISRRLMETELNKLALIRHPNICLFLGASLNNKVCQIVLEHCNHGSLKKYLQDERKREIPVRMQLVVEMAADIARGVQYMHEQCKIILRGLNSDNVFVDEHLQIKISATFGMSHAFKHGDNPLEFDPSNTHPAWTAPEILKGEDYDEKVDVFSFSIILWELMTRQIPYAEVKELRKIKNKNDAIMHAVVEHTMRPTIPVFCPNDLQTLIEHCWSNDSFARPDFTGIVLYLTRMKNVQGILEDHVIRTNETPPRIMKSSLQPPSTRGPKYVKGPVKIPTPGGFIILNPHEHHIRATSNTSMPAMRGFQHMERNLRR